MKKKIIFICGLITALLLVTIFYLYLNQKEYKYICFKITLEKDDLITENILKECTTNKKLPKGVITKKEQLLTEDVYTSYKLIKESYTKEEMLYEDDFILYEIEKTKETELELLKELKVTSIDESNDYVEKFTEYNIYLKDNKVYAKNLDTNKDMIIFDKEEVANIAVRPICCTGNGNLLLLTTNGNVYISEKDVNYSFSFDFPFNKLEGSDIVSFKLIPSSDYDYTKNLYGVNSNNELVLLQKLN